ncbi:MAG: YjbQ family protein [Desulfobacteraceae bacterium]|nr:MAG: YjbQ family protein [Desulfobacteraceae bacterium]
MAEMINLKTGKHTDMVDITAPVQKVISQHDLKDGLCVIYVPHTTAGLTINEGADPAVCRDILAKLNEVIPADARYQHMEGNSDSHIKASLMGSSVTVVIENSRLLLGTWQKIFFCEFDGPKSRQVFLKLIKTV